MAIEIDAIQSAKSIGWTDALLSRLAANSVGLGARLSITAPANASALSSTGYSLTGSNASSMIDLAGVWNTTGTPTLIKANVTDTASNAASLLMDLQVGGTSVGRLRKDGTLQLGGAASELQALGLILNNGTIGNTAWGVYLTGHSGDVNIRDTGSVSWTNGVATVTKDLRLFRDAANTLALRNSTNAQAFNIYNTYTSGSVYERGFMRWVGDVLKIGTETVGGTVRNLRLFGGPTAPGVIQFQNSVVMVGPMLGLGVSQGDISPSASAFFYTPSNGVLRITDSTQADFNRLQFGGTTSSFPALKRSSTVLQSRLADDSDFAPFAASTLALTTPVNTSALSSTGYSLTGSNASSMVDLAGTWNTSGNPVAMKIAISNTASGATAKFLSCLAGASGTTEVFSVLKDGTIQGPTTGDFNIKAVAAGTDFIFTGSAGTEGLRIKATTSNVSVITGNLNIDGGGKGLVIQSDVIVLRDAANTLALRNSTSAQAFNIYNTYTSGSVYERGFMRWASNVLEIGTEHVGASARDVVIHSISGSSSAVRIRMSSAAGSVRFVDSAGDRYAEIASGGKGIFYEGLQVNGAKESATVRFDLNKSGYLDTFEITAPSAPSANGARIYAEDDGAGKTRLMVRFASGAAQQIAIEP